MRRSLVGMALGIAAFLPLSARAADMPQPTLQYPPPAVLQPAPTEYGPPQRARRYVCYAGAIVQGIETHPTFYNIPSGGIDEDAFADGARGGAVAGCDIVFASHTFLGIDTSVTYGNLKGAHLDDNFNIPLEWGTRVRLGYMLDDEWSVYVAGGTKLSDNETNTTTGLIDNTPKWGGVVAVGWEWQFAQNWRVRGEYEFVWSALYGIPYPNDPFSQWAPSENIISLSIMRTFAF